jgi:hypothetical protein
MTFKTFEVNENNLLKAPFEYDESLNEQQILCSTSHMESLDEYKQSIDARLFFEED